MWNNSSSDSKASSTSKTSPQKNAADPNGDIAAEKSLDDIYQPRLQCKSLLEGVDEKIKVIKLLEAEVAKSSTASANIQEKIKKLDQCLQAAVQIAQILQQIPVMLQDIKHTNTHLTHSNEDDDAPSSPRTRETEIVEIQNNTQAKKVISDTITQRIIHNLMTLLEARMNEIKSETITPNTPAQNSTPSKTTANEPLMSDARSETRTASTIREEKLKSFFQQKFSGNYTFIHLAVLTGNPTMLELALHYGVSPYEKDTFKNHAIHYALRKPAMLLIFIEQSIQAKNPLKLNEFYHNGSTLEVFVDLKQKKVDPLDATGYEILKDYRKACMSLNKNEFCDLARTYFDSLAKHDDALRELAVFSRRKNLNPQETLRYSVLMTMPLINDITKPYQKLINQLLLEGKVTLEDFTLPATINIEEDRDNIHAHFQKHCGRWAENRGQAATERKQLTDVVIKHVRFIDFIANFRAMYEAITKRFPSWKKDLHANLRTMCSQALVDLGETRLAALLHFLTSQYQQLETAAMQDHYQKRITEVLLAETPQVGEHYFTQLTASINREIEDSKIDDDSSFKDCYSDDDESTEDTQRNVPLRINANSLLSLQKLKADVVYILRFLTQAQRLAAVEKWVKSITIHRKEDSSDSINDDDDDTAAASTNKENSQDASHFSQVTAAILSKFPVLSLKLGGSNPGSTAGSPRFTSTTNSPRPTSSRTNSPRATSVAGSPRPASTTNSPRASYSTMPVPFRTTTPGENTTTSESLLPPSRNASAPQENTASDVNTTTMTRSKKSFSRRNTTSNISSQVSASATSQTYTARLNLSGTRAMPTAKEMRNDLQQDSRSPIITPKALAKQQSHSPPATPRVVNTLEKANSYSYRSVCDVIFNSTPPVTTDAKTATTTTAATTTTTTTTTMEATSAMTARLPVTAAEASTATTVRLPMAAAETSTTTMEHSVTTAMSLATSLASVTVLATQTAKASATKSNLIKSTIPDRHSVYGEYISDTSNHNSGNLENTDSSDSEEFDKNTVHDDAYQPIMKSHSSLRLGSSSNSSSSSDSSSTSNEHSRSTSPMDQLNQLESHSLTEDAPKYNTLPRFPN